MTVIIVLAESITLVLKSHYTRVMQKGKRTISVVKNLKSRGKTEIHISGNS